MRDVRYFNPTEFAERGQGYVCFGTAPDGLPSIAYVNPPPRGEDLLRAAANALGVKSGHRDYVGTPLGALVEQLDTLIRQRFVQTVADPDGRSTEVVIVPRPLMHLVGQPLLQRILQGNGAFTVSAAADTRVITTMVPLSSTTPEECEREYRFQIGESFLAFPTDGSAPVVVYMVHDANGRPRLSLRRSFMEETMEAFPDSCLTMTVPHRLNPGKGELPVTERYRYTDWRLEYPDAPCTWVVERKTIARCIANLAKSLWKLHLRGVVHGDLKPANTLATTSGLVAIDSLDLADGDQSTAMTKGWAAPEQVMAGDVSFATDQYPIGLMLLALTQGVLYGEEANILVPTGGTGVERHTILRNPGVYIDPEAASARRDKIRPWRRLIEHCLRFSPNERFHSMAELAAELEGLIGDGSPSGVVEVPVSFGRLAPHTDGFGAQSLCWMVD